MNKLNDENKELEKLNTTLIKSLAYEMASNFKQADLRAQQEEKLDEIEKECDNPPSWNRDGGTILAENIKKILER